MPSARTLLTLLLPPLVVGASYNVFLGHRSDYLGHFLAGFGGTLGAVAITFGLTGTVLALPRTAGWITLVIVLACIGLGGILEETLYHIAKWDEVDFCNQSLGAALAGLAALASISRPPDPGYLTREESNEQFRSSLWWVIVAAAWGAIVLAGGYYFAFR